MLFTLTTLKKLEHGV